MLTLDYSSLYGTCSAIENSCSFCRNGMPLKYYVLAWILIIVFGGLLFAEGAFFIVSIGIVITESLQNRKLLTIVAFVELMGTFVSSVLDYVNLITLVFNEHNDSYGAKALITYSIVSFIINFLGWSLKFGFAAMGRPANFEGDDIDTDLTFFKRYTVTVTPELLQNLSFIFSVIRSVILIIINVAFIVVLYSGSYADCKGRFFVKLLVELCDFGLSVAINASKKLYYACVSSQPLTNQVELQSSGNKL